MSTLPIKDQLNYKELSKTLAYALRHAPHLFELELDDEGWVETSTLLDALHERSKWRMVTMHHLSWLVDHQSKRRYEIDGTRFRAIYGHSIGGKLLKIKTKPPGFLYHGTPPGVANVIMLEGMKPMSRQYIHLSTDKPTAMEVGRRRCKKPALIRIDAVAAHEAGYGFYQGNEFVWLADFVPPEFMVIE